VVVGVFPSSSAFSFAVSLPSRVSVFYAKSRTLLKREKKRVSQKFSLLSFSLSKRARECECGLGGKQSPN
jgi:hypothetical protein